ncbi:MAG TPA: MTH938/NDUFAF3 family protein [Acidimicrobiales bacterium]|nr:MTH938/NDUFAF3 family protein [Acidimicrobiales bacterium]
MHFEAFTFGSVQIDGKTYDHDVVLDRGVIRKRDKKASRPLRPRYGHTPLSLSENIPWECRRLVIGTGAQGALPLVPELRREARRRGVELLAMPTVDAIALLGKATESTNAVLHLTC